MNVMMTIQFDATQYFFIRINCWIKWALAKLEDLDESVAMWRPMKSGADCGNGPHLIANY